MNRPENWQFAMDFLGNPEAEEIEKYVADLEANLHEAVELLKHATVAPNSGADVALKWFASHGRFLEKMGV